VLDQLYTVNDCIAPLVETGALTGKPAPTGSPGSSQLKAPATVHAILAARIDRLAPEEKAQKDYGMCAVTKDKTPEDDGVIP